MDFDYSSEVLYIENPYDKLETKLTQGEYLYLYYNYFYPQIFEINYINNIAITSKFKFNLNILKANISEKKFIISNINTKQIRIRINQCNTQSSSNNIKIYYKEESFSFEQNFENDNYSDFNFIYKYGHIYNFFLYEAKEDFILSYTYNDKKDDFISKNQEWEMDG